MNAQLWEEAPPPTKQYIPRLKAVLNHKGVLDVDTVKGCTLGMAHTKGGCYGECYAAKTAHRYGIDFKTSISRKLYPWSIRDAYTRVVKHNLSWYRIGVSGDPSHDWENTVKVCETLAGTNKIPVIVTKHWRLLSDKQIARLKKHGAVFNTSVSVLDDWIYFSKRLGQAIRLKDAGLISVLRVVTAQFGNTEWGKERDAQQKWLLSKYKETIDTPLRVPRTNDYVKRGDIKVMEIKNSVGGGSKLVSLHDPSIFLGLCCDCPDQCGVK